MIESLTTLTIRLPNGVLQTLTPGSPVDLPDTLAQRLLARVPEKVLVPTDWQSAWQELAQITHGITREDRRFTPVLSALDQCDECFLARDSPAFREAAARVKQIVGEGTAREADVS